jgi:hypothetical protein
LSAKRADCRMRVSSPLISLSAASVVLIKFEANSLFSTAWRRLPIWARNCSEITSPDGSSLARLIRKPVESLSRDLNCCLSVFERLRSAVTLATFVLMRKPMAFPP